MSMRIVMWRVFVSWASSPPPHATHSTHATVTPIVPTATHPPLPHGHHGALIRLPKLHSVAHPSLLTPPETQIRTKRPKSCPPTSCKEGTSADMSQDQSFPSAPSSDDELFFQWTFARKHCLPCGGGGGPSKEDTNESVLHRQCARGISSPSWTLLALPPSFLDCSFPLLPM